MQNFISDFSAILTNGACEGESHLKLLNEVICEHFLRQGMLDIAEALNEVTVLFYVGLDLICMYAVM